MTTEYVDKLLELSRSGKIEDSMPYDEFEEVLIRNMGGNKSLDLKTSMYVALGVKQDFTEEDNEVHKKIYNELINKIRIYKGDVE